MENVIVYFSGNLLVPAVVPACFLWPVVPASVQISKPSQCCLDLSRCTSQRSGWDLAGGLVALVLKVSGVIVQGLNPCPLH